LCGHRQNAGQIADNAGSRPLDTTYAKVRRAGRIVSIAVTIAVGVNRDGRRELLGMAIGASEAKTFWPDLLR
jgi:transposase-like protein